MDRDLDPRWREPERPEQTWGSRGGADPREPIARDPRDVFARGLSLPRASERQRVSVRGRCYSLRGSEVRVLATVGAFRVVPVRDLALGASRDPRARDRDVEHLRSAGLIEARPFGAGRARTTLLTLSERARDLLDAAQDRAPDERQRFYAGFARRPELAHDSQLFRAYLHAAERLQMRGGRIRRVRLDYELKREYQEFLQERNRGRRDSSGRPDRSSDEIREWAHAHQLPVEDDHLQFPDVRIEYEDLDGRRAVEDLEVITPHYRGAHAAAKARSGFKQYRSVGVRAGGGRGGGGRGRPFNPRVAEEFL